ncbi:MAG: hypothetical protein JW940_16365 [Polyangiaceae bacterium]|nr:hypothetical protein [Polyangiaceae bacterium]
MKKNLQSHRRMLVTVALLCTAGLCTAGCGDSKEESNPWVGHTYALDIPDGNWTEPPGVGGEFGPFVPDFAIQVEASSGDQLDVLLGALDADGKQEQRNPTTAVKAKSSSGFELGPVDVPLYVVNGDLEAIGTIYGLTMTNVMPDGATVSETGTFSGVMDARQFYCLFTAVIPRTPVGVCTAVAEYTKNEAHPVSCGPCPNDNEPYCFTLTATELGATQVGTSVQPVDTSSVQPCAD